MSRRVVITGIGLMTPQVEDKDSLLDLVLSGSTQSKCQAEIPDFMSKAEQRIPFNNLRRMAKYSALALYTHILAKEDSGIEISELNQERIGSIMNTVYGPLKVTESFLKTLITQGPKNVSPNDFANTVINCATGQVSIHYKLKGVSSTLVGSSALAYAVDLIAHGKADALFVSGVEEHHPVVEANYSGNDYTFTENSACLVLESYDHALARQATMYAELVACGLGTDGAQSKRIDALHGEGPQRALRQLQSRLNDPPALVDVLWASSPLLADVHEKELSLVQEKFKVRKHWAWKAKFGETLGCNEILPAAIASMLVNHHADNRDRIGGDPDSPVMVMSCQPGGSWSSILLKRVSA